MNARVALAAGVIAAAGVACSLHISGAAFDGGATASDAGADVDVDAVANDAGGDAPPSSRFCERGTHVFCADFDTAPDRPWAFCDRPAGPDIACGATVNGGGVLALDPGTNVSPPASLSAQTGSFDAGIAQALLSRAVPGTGTNVALVMSFRVDVRGAAASVGMASVLLGDTSLSRAGHALAITLAAPDDAGGNVQLGVIEANAGAVLRTTLAFPAVTVGAWHQLVIDVHPTSFVVTLDGVAAAPVTMAATHETNDRAVSVGLSVASPASAWQLHFDDVAFDEK